MEPVTIAILLLLGGAFVSLFVMRVSQAADSTHDDDGMPQ